MVLTISTGASTLSEALRAVPNLRVDVAIPDGNMGTNSRCGDGEEVAALIRQYHPKTVTVGLSAGEFLKGTVDIRASKFHIPWNTPKLVELIGEIRTRVRS